MTSVYKLTVRASDALTGARAEVTIDLLVNDVNDNSIFGQPTYNTILSEASSSGHLFYKLCLLMQTQGTNKMVHYQIVQILTTAQIIFT